VTVTLAAVRAAAAASAGEVLCTPLVPSPALSARAGCDVRLKLENLQPTGSFKLRGALNRLRALTAAERRRGVIALSAGNHAQAVAYLAARIGVPATIVMPVNAPFTKVAHSQRYGGRVLQHGQTLQEGQALLEDLAAREGLTVIHPYDDPLVVAGQGTVGLEMLAQEPALDALVVPVGGGGLITGIAVAAKALKPEIEIIGVQSARFPAMRALLGKRVTRGGGITIADGIAVKSPGAIARRLLPRLVGDIVLAEEDALECAVALLAEDAHLVAEGAGAAALAAVLASPRRFKGRVVGVVVSGGNIDGRLLATVLLRALVKSGRMIRLRIDLADTPGTLARVASLIGEAGGNIVELTHQRMFHDVPPRQAELDVMLETRDAAHGAAIEAALAAAGFSARRLSDTAAEPAAVRPRA